MNLNEFLLNDQRINTTYPAAYAQGQRYQDIQSMLQPQYSAQSPTELYKQARMDLDSLSAPSVPTRAPGLLGQPEVAAESPKAMGLLEVGGEGGMAGSPGPGGGFSMGAVTPGEMASLGLGLLGGPLGFGLALAQVAMDKPGFVAQTVDGVLGLDSMGLGVDVAAIDNSDIGSISGADAEGGGFGGIGGAVGGGYGDPDGFGGFGSDSDGFGGYA